MVLATLCGCGEVGKNNPLINPGETPHGTPEFSKITLDHYREAFDIALQEAKAEFEEMVNNTEEPTFENTILALENNGKLLNKVSTIFFALDNVESTDETQQLILEVEPKLVAFNNDIRLNPVVFERVKSVYDNRESLNLDKEQAKLLDDTYKSFIRGGAGLDEEQKEKYRQLSSELSTLTTTFGINVLAQTNAYKLNISSTKSMTGHLLGAAGALEAVLCIKAMEDGIVPPTINHEEGDNDPEIDYNLNFTFNKAQKREIRAVMSNTFGFGGHNACVILKKFEK